MTNSQTTLDSTNWNMILERANAGVADFKIGETRLGSIIYSSVAAGTDVYSYDDGFSFKAEAAEETPEEEEEEEEETDDKKKDGATAVTTFATAIMAAVAALMF